MLKAVSTYLYVKERLHPGILDGLARSGVQAIEIFAARQHLDYANRKAHVKEIAEWFRGSGIPLNSVHSPLYADYEWGRTGAPPVNIASTDRAGRIEAMDEIKRALEIAEQIPFRFLVQHIGTPNESSSEKKIEAAMTSLEHLRAFAKPLGVRILLENTPNELSTGKPRWNCCAPRPRRRRCCWNSKPTIRSTRWKSWRVRSRSWKRRRHS